MKKLFIVLVLSSICSFSYGGTKVLLVSTSNILDGSVWQPVGVPNSGDTIIVPAGRQLILALSFSFPFNVHLRIYGELRMTGAPLSVSLDPTSTIIIYGGGRLSGTNVNQAIYLNGVRIFTGTTPVNGAMWAAVATNGFIPYVALPVKFISFTAVRKQQSVEIRWTTTEEQDAQTYIIEKSMDGDVWSDLTSLPANNSTTAINEYSYTDIINRERIIYYRIRQIDIGGAFSYTVIKSVKNETELNMVGITAASNKINLSFTETIAGDTRITVCNWQGQVIHQQRLASASAGRVAIPFYQKGNFVVIVSSPTGLKASEKVIMQ